MIHPKICKEPSLRERYKGYKQFNVYHRERAYTFTVDGKGKVIICHSKFRVFKNKHINKLIDYCKEKNKEIKLIADEEKEIWYL